MSVLLIEGFETDRSSTYLGRRYDAAVGWGTDQTGRLQGSSMQGASNSVLRTRSFGLKSTLTFAFAFQYTSSISSPSNPQIVFRRGLTEQCRLQIEGVTSSTFRWVLKRGATTIDTSSSTFATNIWHYFELEVTFNTTTGSYELRHNQVDVMSGTGANTAGSGSNDADVLDLQVLNASTRWDDMYLIDDAGTINNSFLGDSVIEGRLPTGDGTLSQWTRSEGAQTFALLDDPADSPAPNATQDAELVSSATVGQIDFLTFDPLTFIEGTIHAIQLMASARLDTLGTSRNVRYKLRSGGSNYDGDSFSVASTAFSVEPMVSETDPDTGVKWTPSGVDSAEFGYELVS